MRDKTENLLMSLLDSGLSSLFDPNPVYFKPEHERGVKPLNKLLSCSPIELQQVPKKLTRNEFLCGCLDFTENEKKEHLVIGYGFKRGKGTDICTIQHIIGSEHSVSIPNSVIQTVNDYSTSRSRAEIIMFHNHPYNWLNALIDNLPLASQADREMVLKKKYLKPFQFILSLLGINGIRFYLGENGFVGEIRAPSVIRILQIYNQSTPPR